MFMECLAVQCCCVAWNMFASPMQPHHHRIAQQVGCMAVEVACTAAAVLVLCMCSMDCCVPQTADAGAIQCRCSSDHKCMCMQSPFMKRLWP
jgi:hypothetical protein